MEPSRREQRMGAAAIGLALSQTRFSPRPPPSASVQGTTLHESAGRTTTEIVEGPPPCRPRGHDSKPVSVRATSSAHEPSAPTTKAVALHPDTPETIKGTSFEPTGKPLAPSEPPVTNPPRTTVSGKEALGQEKGRGSGARPDRRTPAPVIGSRSTRPSSSLPCVTPDALPRPPARTCKEEAATRPPARAAGSTAPSRRRRPPRASTTTTPHASPRPGQDQPMPRHPAGAERGPVAVRPPWKGHRPPLEPPTTTTSRIWAGVARSATSTPPGLQPPRAKEEEGAPTVHQDARRRKENGAVADQRLAPPSSGGRPVPPVTYVWEEDAPPPPVPRGLWPATPPATARDGAGRGDEGGGTRVASRGRPRERLERGGEGQTPDYVVC